VRRRVLPPYRNPFIVPKGESERRYIDPDEGSITDGDDQLLTGDPELLKGGGGWKELVEGTGGVTSTKVLGKRTRRQLEDESPPTQSEIVDLTQSSSPMLVDSENEEEVEVRVHLKVLIGRLTLRMTLRWMSNAARLRRRADQLEKAAKIFCEQAEQRNTIWIRSGIRRDVGRDVDDLVADITGYTHTARKRDKTWANGKNKVERRQEASGLRMTDTRSITCFSFPNPPSFLNQAQKQMSRKFISMVCRVCIEAQNVAAYMTNAEGKPAVVLAARALTLTVRTIPRSVELKPLEP
jgi:hypothetical protein